MCHVDPSILPPLACTGLKELLQSTQNSLEEQHASAVSQFLNSMGKAGEGAGVDDLMNLLALGTQVHIAGQVQVQRRCSACTAQVPR